MAEIPFIIRELFDKTKDKYSWDTAEPEKYVYLPTGDFIRLSDYLEQTLPPPPLAGEAVSVESPFEFIVSMLPMSFSGKALKNISELAKSVLTSQTGRVSLKPTRVAPKNLPSTWSARRQKYPGLDINEVLGKDLLERIRTEGYNMEIRDEILKRLAISPERKAMLEEAKPHIENIAKAAGEKTRGYLYGSVTSTKPKIGDVDLLVYMPYSDREAVRRVEGEAWRSVPPVHTMITHLLGRRRSTPSDIVQSWAQQARDVLQERYPGAKFIRLWSAPTSIVPLLDEMSTYEE